MKSEFLRNSFLKVCNSKAGRSALMWWAVAIIVAGVFCIMDFSVYSAQPSKKTEQVSSTKTNVVTTNIPVVVEIPQSVFIWNPKERGYGRDPFFPVKPKAPLSVIPTNQVATTPQQVETKQPPSRPKIEFVLNGLIGKVACVINGKQIMVGSEESVPVSGGKVKIRCDKIENSTAFITVFFEDGSTEMRELALKERK
ncbi:MAG: hypothetical protein N2487_02850 [Verrucomicrobiae bacterium]|nr:hypothetical protein [Verrucomicrobiae bacterium]